MTSWNINNKTVQSLTIGNKEVASILRLSDNTTIYSKSSPTPVSVDSITLTEANNKTILSKHHNETASMIATALDSSNNPVSGVSMSIMVDGTTVKTQNTDSNGQVTYTYNASGVGDIVISAECSSKTQTYNIEDCIFYDTTEYTKIGGNKVIATLSALPNSWEISYDYKTNAESRVGLFSQANFVDGGTNNPNYSVFTGSPNGTNRWYYGYRATSTSTTDVTSTSVSDYETNKFRRNNSNTITYTRVKTNKTYTKSVSWFNNYTYHIGIVSWGTGTTYAKNIKLKAL